MSSLDSVVLILKDPTNRRRKEQQGLFSTLFPKKVAIVFPYVRSKNNKEDNNFCSDELPLYSLQERGKFFSDKPKRHRV